jgi:hypothetical protein
MSGRMDSLSEGPLDPDKRRALSDFYREEFLRHLAVLDSSGIFEGTHREIVDRAYRRLVTDLDRVCCRSEFPALAENLLQSFEALTRLSVLQRRPLH